ncbi:hypothetical protein MIND_00216200 [Mycena indigotica]|uniref:EXPERA domain-containing protein n=1 Tax=Mycena indigotica TaxID=2126181 RepID=A0A8H6T895_9AGAR|nr:uncharacterized protein MIND_00216200 [Mycena indigotica]KAF7312041.1 hypothetical protein MIND_00216200 [Mycena indigotica]
MAGRKYAWVSLWLRHLLLLRRLLTHTSPFRRFLLTAPLMIWDAGYCLMRPRSMPGGDLYWFWKPYELYGMVDYVRGLGSSLWSMLTRIVRQVYGVKAYENGEGFASAAAILNLLETFANIGYLVGTHVVPFDAAPLVGYTGATATLAKTVLYSSQEYFCNGCAVGHNTPFNLFAFWVFPNIVWMLFTAGIMLRLGSDMMGDVKRAREIAGQRKKT